MLVVVWVTPRGKSPDTVTAAGPITGAICVLGSSSAAIHHRTPARHRTAAPIAARPGNAAPASKKKNGRLVVARRPFPIGLSKVVALLPPFFSHLPPVGCSAASGGRGGALVRSPGRMAIPPGSSIRALRVGSGRGPTVRTALRGAKSEWMKHATGFTCPSRGDHQDRREPEPLVASALSPDIPLEPARPAVTEARGPSTCPTERVE